MLSTEKKIRHFTVAILMASASAVFVSAEPAEQNPGNAHLFLTQLSEQNRVQFEPPEYYARTKTYGTSGYNGEYRLTWDEFQSNMSPWPLSIASSAGCHTKLMSNSFADFKAYSQEASFYSRSAKMDVPGTEKWYPFVPHWQHIKANGIDWAKVSTVTNEKSAVVWLRGPAFSGGYGKLIFESPEMAARAAFAMELIRQSCDPFANTGF